MVNKVILVGNVGRDVESLTLQDGTMLSKFSIATKESYYDKEKNLIENTEWHNITAWRKLAEFVRNYVKKGSTLYVEGKIRKKSYLKDGETRYSTEIEATEVRVLKWPDSGTTTTSLDFVAQTTIPQDNLQF